MGRAQLPAQGSHLAGPRVGHRYRLPVRPRPCPPCSQRAPCRAAAAPRADRAAPRVEIARGARGARRACSCSGARTRRTPSHTSRARTASRGATRLRCPTAGTGTPRSCTRAQRFRRTAQPPPRGLPPRALAPRGLPPRASARGAARRGPPRALCTKGPAARLMSARARVQEPTDPAPEAAGARRGGRA